MLTKNMKITASLLAGSMALRLPSRRIQSTSFAETGAEVVFESAQASEVAQETQQEVAQTSEQQASEAVAEVQGVGLGEAVATEADAAVVERQKEGASVAFVVDDPPRQEDPAQLDDPSGIDIELEDLKSGKETIDLDKVFYKKPYDPNEDDQEYYKDPRADRLYTYCLSAGLGSCAFGFVDNCMMVLCGVPIDKQISKLGFGKMMSAGLGNTVSDVIGVFVGSYIEKARDYIIPSAKYRELSDDEVKYGKGNFCGGKIRAKYVKTCAGCIGIAVGTISGMLPLVLGYGEGACARGSAPSMKKPANMAAFGVPVGMTCAGLFLIRDKIWYEKGDKCCNPYKRLAPEDENDKQTLIGVNKHFTMKTFPSLGFGFMDNCIMVIAGDMIDSYFGSTGMSSMCAAGFGNCVSDVVGSLVSDKIDQVAEKTIKPPNLDEDEKLKQAFDFCPKDLLITTVGRVGTLGEFLGMSFGALLGLTPLRCQGGSQGRALSEGPDDPADDGADDGAVASIKKQFTEEGDYFGWAFAAGLFLTEQYFEWFADCSAWNACA